VDPVGAGSRSIETSHLEAIMKISRISRFAGVAGALALALVLGSVARRVTAQPPSAASIQAEDRARPIEIDRGAAALWQSLLKLHTRASMIMIVAHPDDEDGSLLAYESRGQGARVALLTLNRGEGGQNLMSSDYFDALGLVRSEELLDADQYYGAQQYFTRVIDFGFSKSKEETLDKWGHQRVLGDVVRVVRMVRPLVLTSVFVGGPTDGHGHHQTSGEMTQEAFNDAGNPNMFPDQIRDGLQPWTPLKDYARVPGRARIDNPVGFGDEGAVGFGKIFDYASGKAYPLRFFDYITGKWIDGMLSTDLTVPEGQYDPWLGGSFVQVARQGLGSQKSQDGGLTPPPPGPQEAHYHLFGSRVNAPAGGDSMFAGIDVSLAGIADLAAGGNNAFLKTGLAEINSDVEQAMHQFDPQRLDAIAPQLAAGAKANLALIDKVQSSSLTPEAKYNVLHELHVKQSQFNTALAEALGLSVDVSVTTAQTGPSGAFGRRGPVSTPRVAIPGQTLYLSVRAANVGGLPVAIQRVWVDTPQGETWTATPEGQAPASLDANQVKSERFQVQVPEDAQFTKPYFTRKNLRQNYYAIDDPKYLSLPFEPYPVSGWMEFEYDGVAVRIGQAAQTAEREVGLGDVQEPLVVAPAISLWLPAHAGVVPMNAKSFDLSVVLHSNALGAAQGTVKLDLPGGWSSDPATASFSVAKTGQDETVNFQVRPSGVEAKPYQILAVATYDGREYSAGYEQTGYPGLRPYNLYYPADYKTTGVDLKVAPGLKVGFVPGTGSQLPLSLASVGIQTTFLGPQDIASGDLSKFDVIIVGVRAYSVRPDLATYNQRLLDFVRQGGTLIVQYQDGNYNHNYGPYPLSVGIGSNATLTDEDSAVQFLLPDNAALAWPNKIGPQDFTGWVEERGHGFADSWDPRWQSPFEMHDQGQAPQKGGLLIARYGKGEYVYLALALYRQLPEGVPGSYRIIANLLSLGANPALGPAKGASSR
jgi:LmbE family N-acetylglucosaminyl deacetylase